ncbi:THUMP domain-containing protein [Chromobacterium haemolyticum]|uniref:THUMP domain-containing protein n=1 Tax=Chromobacterium TaxID=535 RepID=UPI004056E3CA
MSSFRSRQRANMRRDFNSRDNEASSPAGGDSPAGKSPVIQKKAPSADASPRAPYSGPRPGNAKPNWQDRGAGQGQTPRDGGKRGPYQGRDQQAGRDKPYGNERRPQGQQRFERNEGQDNFKQDRFNKERGNNWQQRSFARDGEERPQGSGPKKPFHHREDREPRDYSRDRGPSGRKPLNATADVEQERKPYSRDRGPSGRKPLHLERDGEQGAPQGKPRWQQPDGERHVDQPRKPFNPSADREQRFRRDDAEQAPRKPWQERQHSEQREDGPRKLFGKSAKHDNHFRRDDAEQTPRKPWQERQHGESRDDAPRKPWQERQHSDRRDDAPRKPWQERQHGDRDNRFRRDDAEQAPRKPWQQNEPAERGEDGPRKLFGKSAERDNRFRRDDSEQAPRQDRRQSEPAERSEGGPRKLFSKPSYRDNDVRRDDAERTPRQSWQQEERPRHERREGETRQQFGKPGAGRLKPLGDQHRVETRGEHRYAEAPRHAPSERQAPSLTQVRDSVLSLFAPCPRGLEAILADELRGLGARDIATADGGVAFAGDRDLLMAANLHSRTASRVLLQLAQGGYRNEQDIYRLAMNVDWPRWFDVSNSIKLKTDAIRCHFKSLDFISLKVKDAICDRFRQAQLGRPNVDTRHPDVRIHVFLTEDSATIYLDTSGEPLFKRGWRQETGDAPLRENLAAGILMLTGYNGSQPLLDPMCGSGTFLVEAADIALNRAPGRQRKFAFQKLRGFDSASWEKLLLDALHAEKPLTKLTINGSDRDQAIINVAKDNLERAGLSGLVELKAMDVLDARPNGENGILVANPPYGVRMDELDQLAEWYPQLGDWLKAHFAGWHANLFSGDLRLAKLIHLSPKRRTPLYNGSLQCRLFVINMVEGSARKEKPGEQAEAIEQDDHAAE